MSRRKQRRIQQTREFQDRTGRKTYLTGTEWFDGDSVRVIWKTGVEVLRPVLASAKVDLFPDPSWGQSFEALSPAARDGWAILHDEVKSKKGMGVPVGLGDDRLFAAFRDFGIESIHAVAASEEFAPSSHGDPVVGNKGLSIVFRKDDPEFPLVSNHDQGYSVEFELTDEERRVVHLHLQRYGISSSALKGPSPSPET